MQQPTLTNVRIRSTRDALHIFYAVARNVLPMTTRRLDAEERRASVSIIHACIIPSAHFPPSVSSLAVCTSGRSVVRIQKPLEWEWNDGARLSTSS